MKTQLLLTFACALAAQTLPPAAQKFAGNWVEDQAQRKNGSQRHLVFRETKPNGLEELRGSLLNPEVQPVTFGTRPYHFTGNAGRNTIAWSDLGSGKFERTLTGPDNKTISVRHIEISADGKTLTEAVDTMTGGKTTHSTTTYSRQSGNGRTLAGDWRPTSFKSDSPATLTVSASGAGLTVDNRTSKTQLSLDGKPAPVMGPAVISGSTLAAILKGANLEVTNARSGVVGGHQVWTLSADGKTLTTTTTNADPNAGKEPSVTVYRKQ